jgi:hypothetical protein
LARVGAHALLSLRREGCQLGDETAVFVEELLGMVAAHPLLEQCELRRVIPHVCERHLVGAEGALDRQAVRFRRAGPALRRPQNDRRPAGTSREAVFACLALDRADLGVATVQRRGEHLVHAGRVPPLDEVDRVAVPFEQLANLVVRGPAEHGGVGYLVAVEVQYGEHRAVARGVEKADPFPRALQRPRLRLPVTDHGGDYEVGVIEGRTEGVGEDVAELSALVDRAGGGHADVAGHAAGCRELAEEPPQARSVLRHLRVDLGVGAFEVQVRQDGRSAVTRTGQVDHLGAALPDEAIEVDIDQAEARRGTPVSEEARLDVLGS